MALHEPGESEASVNSHHQRLSGVAIELGDNYS